MRTILDFFYPPRCLLCEVALHKEQIALCEGCRSDLVPNHRACRCCGLPLQPDTSEGLCADCLQQRPPFTQLWSPFVYAQPLEWMIQQFKFNAKLSCVPVLSALMLEQMPAQWLKAHRPDALIPMPLHPARQRQRGFNQSELLARPLAQALGIRLDTQCCKRQRNTEHQTGMNAKQRRKNIQDAFHFTPNTAYRHVVIFDDVVTTGSTVSELSRLILKSGVERVDVWSLARADKTF